MNRYFKATLLGVFWGAVLAFFTIGVITFLAPFAQAQPTVHLRDNPIFAHIVSPGCTNATPMVCTLDTITGFTAGQTVTVNGVCANNSGANYISTANGLRKVGVVSGSTISLTDTGGTNIAGNGTWCDGSNSVSTAGPQWVGVVNPYALTQGVKEEFDGDSGSLTRQWALGTQNGLDATNGLVCNGSSCTVKTSYVHGINVGDHISIYGSGNTNLNRDGISTDYTVSSKTVNQFIFSTTGVSAGNYTNYPHCGPGGSPNGTVQGTDNCLRISQRAVTTNYYWSVLKSDTDGKIAANHYKFPVDGGGYSNVTGALAWEGAALIFMLDQANQTYLDVVDYAIQNVEKMGGVTFPATEATQNDGGNYQLYDDSNPAALLGLVFKVGAPYQTATQKQDFIDKMTNDLGDPTPCVKTLSQPYVVSSGTSQSGDPTTITLDAADSYTYVAGQVLRVYLNYPGFGGTFAFYAAIASYNSGTKVATLAPYPLAAQGTSCPHPGAAPTTLNGAINNSQTTITVASGASATNGQLFSIDAEAMTLVSGAGTTTWTVTRANGWNGYTPAAHSNGAAVLLTPIWVDNYCHPGAFPATAVAYIAAPAVSVSGSTVTGAGTTFSSIAHVGDMVDGGVKANGNGGCWITAVNSDTSLSVVCAQTPDCTAGMCATQQFLVYYPKWTNGTSGTPRSCGYKWGQAHFGGWGGSQPVSYPQNGGSTAYVIGSTNLETTIESTWLGFMFDVADEDTVSGRAVTNLATRQSNVVDNLVSWNWNYDTGATGDGSWYGLGKTQDSGRFDWYLIHDIVGYPSVGADTQMVSISALKMYQAVPDQPWNGSYNTQGILPFGQFGGPCLLPANYCSGAQEMVLDWGMELYPANPMSQYLNGWIKNKMQYQSTHTFSFAANWVAATIDPRIVAADYTLQPPQYILNKSAHSVCQSLSGGWPVGGWGCPDNQSAGMMYSRTGWSSTTDASLLFEMRALSGGHDGIAPANMQFYRTGWLLGNDAPGSYPIGTDVGDQSVYGSAAAFGNNNWNYMHWYGSVPGTTQVLRWASANHGSWPTAYGDQSGNYAYVAAEFKGMYRLNSSSTETPNSVQVSMADMKKPGTEHTLIRYDRYDLAAPDATSIAVHTHYPQNGETDFLNGGPNPFYNSYIEGTTSCPGSGGCGNLNANRVVLEQETGATALPGAPSPNANLISQFVVPSGAPNVFIQWDGSTYSGAGGHTDRVSFCADASSTGACGATGQTRLELIQVHKVATQPDTSLTVTALNPDANWTGVQTTDKVVLFARGGVTQAALTTFTTTHSGTAQYLIGGLTAGAYTVSVGGVVKWTGTVAAGDNSVEFDSTAGAVVLTTGTLPGWTVRVN